MNISSIRDRLCNANILGDENITLSAISTCFMPTRWLSCVLLLASVVDFWLSFRTPLADDLRRVAVVVLNLLLFWDVCSLDSFCVSAISTARRQMSRQRRASPESAATCKKKKVSKFDILMINTLKLQSKLN